jgi:hypothetical protein
MREKIFNLLGEKIIIRGKYSVFLNDKILKGDRRIMFPVSGKKMVIENINNNA